MRLLRYDGVSMCRNVWLRVRNNNEIYKQITIGETLVYYNHYLLVTVCHFYYPTGGGRVHTLQEEYINADFNLATHGQIH